MCEAMGNAPIDSEIPVELDELLFETQQAIRLYQYLPDVWSNGMQPFYVGKDYTNLKFFMEVMDVDTEAYLYIIETLRDLDIKNATSINGKMKRNTKAKK